MTVDPVVDPKQAEHPAPAGGQRLPLVVAAGPDSGPFRLEILIDH
jgi:hypothetical protein